VVIVVIGSPILRLTPGRTPAEAGGLAADVAVSSAAAGAAVELIGNVGRDDAGDRVLVSLNASRVGHAAMLRDAANATPTEIDAGEERPEWPEDSVLGPDSSTEPGSAPVRGLPLAAADIDLALRYLVEFRVLVIATGLNPAAAGAALDAAAFTGAHVVRLDGDRARADAAAPSSVGSDAAVTAFAPPSGREPAFAWMVGRYAAALDAGRSARDAFAEATRGSAWERAPGDDQRLDEI
jgi:hypothetical protein